MLANFGGMMHSETVAVDNISSIELWKNPELFKADLLFWIRASLAVSTNINQSIDRSINQLTNQPTNQPINQSINQSIKHHAFHYP